MTDAAIEAKKRADEIRENPMKNLQQGGSSNPKISGIMENLFKRKKDRIHEDIFEDVSSDDPYAGPSLS